MTDQLKLVPIPFHFNHQLVQFVMIGYEPYLLANDIRKLLGFSSELFLQDYLDTDEYTYALVKFQDKFFHKLLISQSGIFTLIQISASPDAGDIRRWLARDVYPFIFKSILDLSVYSQSLTYFKVDVGSAKHNLKQAEERLAKALIKYEIASQILPPANPN